MIQETEPYLKQDEDVMNRLRLASRGNAQLAVYMKNHGGYPIYDKTYAEYFPWAMICTLNAFGGTEKGRNGTFLWSISL